MNLAGSNVFQRIHVKCTTADSHLADFDQSPQCYEAADQSQISGFLIRVQKILQVILLWFVLNSNGNLMFDELPTTHRFPAICYLCVYIAPSKNARGSILIMPCLLSKYCANGTAAKDENIATEGDAMKRDLRRMSQVPALPGCFYLSLTTPSRTWFHCGLCSDLVA